MRARGKISPVMRNPERIAILLLGGSGTRFGGETPKQLLPVAGKRLFEYPLSALEESPFVDKVYLVVREDLKETVNRLVSKYVKVQNLVGGGDTREESVKNALTFLESQGVNRNSLILIQDADRPNLTLELIRENFERAEKTGAAVTAIPCSDSIFRSDDSESIDQYLSRSGVYLAQTPQTFVFSLLQKAHASVSNSTDDGSKVLSLGGKIAIVPGSPNNYKINYPSDLKRFEKEVEP